MRDSLHVRDVRLVLATRLDAERGLVGFVKARYGGLLLDGIALRWTRRGRPVLSWPRRRDRRGRNHAVVRPSSRAMRRALDRQILDALGLGDGGPP